ncbi:sulfotransferase family 2 domain-containing protein [Shimia sp.]|uniref:sulfotransferase family 2 domain-containing protein n=1 Tax=Shimia sp. TaxID=1954381 RepID=UPI00329A16C5
MTKTCLLHIGKTGGTYLKSVIAHNQENLPNDVEILSHYDTIFSTVKKFGRARKIGFVFREPEKRFISGFQSRIRQGRPTYNSPWTAEEGVAFHWFATPNDLAEALGSKDERMKSAAIFAMHNIRHIKFGYKHFLGGKARLAREVEKGKMQLCVELENVDENLPEIMQSIGFKKFSLPKKPVRHNVRLAQVTQLSEIGRANLHSYWAEEFEIYEFCKQIATIHAQPNL